MEQETRVPCYGKFYDFVVIYLYASKFSTMFNIDETEKSTEKS